MHLHLKNQTDKIFRNQKKKTLFVFRCSFLPTRNVQPLNTLHFHFASHHTHEELPPPASDTLGLDEEMKVNKEIRVNTKGRKGNLQRNRKNSNKSFHGLSWPLYLPA